MRHWAVIALLAVLLSPGCGDDGAGNNGNNNNGIDPRLCGNGELDGLEECDDGPDNSDTEIDACRTSCLLAHCGDGVVDTGEPCDDGPANHDQVPDACRSDCTPPVCGDLVVDIGGGELCDDGNTDDGDGCSALCQPELCGNGIVDPNEVCDDGNFDAGDGCSAYCTSDETCGNAIIDYEAGETCDDGNAASHDGCASSCTAEIPKWRRWKNGWGSRREHGAAFYTTRGALFLFGGLVDGDLAGDTWAFDGYRWWRIVPWVSPPARRGHTMVYDAYRDRIILFGGDGLNGAMNDTWEFNGYTWKELSPATAPPARFAHGMTFDTHRGRVVVFGGLDGVGGTRLDDTWEFDGDTWVERITPTTPPALDGLALAYDPGRRVTVLFGGQSSAGIENATWELSGSGWAQRTFPPGADEPAPRRSAAAAYFVVPLSGSDYRPGVVVHGGLNHLGVAHGDFWVFDGTEWNERSGGFGHPGQRYGHTLTYSPPSYSLTLVGGDGSGSVFQGGEGAPPADTWAFQLLEGAPFFNWEEINVELTPPIRDGAVMAWDSARERMVLYGGRSRGWIIILPIDVALTDTWEFDGLQWYPTYPASNAGERIRAAMAYHQTRGKMVLFGGTDVSGNPQGSTATYDGTDWTVSTPSTTPSPRHGHAMAYDPVEDAVVLFGGQAGSLSDETWVWDDGWSLVNTANAPSPREGHRMVWDEEQQHIVLYGGLTGPSTHADDTWIFDGTDWIQQSLTQSPPPRRAHGMAHHNARRRTVLFGGIRESLMNDTWEYHHDDGFWLGVVPSESPTAREKSVMEFNPVLRAIMLFGGSGSTPIVPFLNDTWLFGYDSDLPEEDCSNGVDDDTDQLVDCADPDCEGRSCDNGGICAAGACACWGGSVESACDDGYDNDCDGLTDCADSDCGSAAGCGPTEQSCIDAFDNDGDGYSDCGDPDCATDPACDQSICTDWMPLHCNAVEFGSTLGAPSNITSYSCDAGTYDGAESAFRFVAPWTGTFTAGMSQLGLALRLTVIDTDATGACDPGDCLAIAPAGMDTSIDFNATQGQTVFIVVDGPAGSGAAFGVAVACPLP